MSSTGLAALKENEPLTDEHMNSSVILLKRQFPQAPIDVSTAAVFTPRERIFFIEVYKSYWVCCSTIKCIEKGVTVHLYDSTCIYNNVEQLEQSLLTKLKAVLGRSPSKIQIMECQESSYLDSGVHAIANATVLCYELAI